MPDRPKQNGQARISPARETAFQLLERIASSDAHSDDLLHSSAMTPLSQADRDLVHALVLGVLRWQIALDAHIRQFLSRPDTEVALPVAIALRLGAFQLLHMDRIPPHAALNESVELVRRAGHAHASGMVNAILRKLSTAPAPRRPLVESSAALAERLGHPLWIVERWIRRYGRPAAEAICASDQQQPAFLDLFPQDMEQRLQMDAGSRLVAEIAAFVGAQASRVWDCCAAPGGKTMALSHRLTNAEMLASDVSAPRLSRLQQRLGRELPDGTVQTLQLDVTKSHPEIGSFDLILCDVPCSGTGTLARNPEIRHRLRPEDLKRQAKRQVEILQRALERLQPGGHLVYSTCSLEVEENEQVVEAILNGQPDLQVRATESVLQGMIADGSLRLEASQSDRLVRGTNLRTLPGYGFQGDGFFATIFHRPTDS